jgi:hypothetical protein
MAHQDRLGLALDVKPAAQEEERRRAEAEEKPIAEGRQQSGKAPKPPSEEPIRRRSARCSATA